MIPIKSERDLRVMRKSCEIAATVLDKISKLAVAGVSTWDLNEAAKRWINTIAAALRINTNADL